MSTNKTPAWISHSVPQTQFDYNPVGVNQDDRPTLGPRKVTAPRRVSHALWKWWILEIVCVLIGTAALIALIIVLRRYDGKPVKLWPWSITPNSLVAVFTTLIKVMAMLPVADCIGQLKWVWFTRGKGRPLADMETFDSASRGILGSISLLWRLRFM